jgi:5'-nucleotidase
MRILVSNDDGYLAPGIVALASALSSVGEVTVVAPDRDRSGASSSLTLTRPLRVNRAANGFYYVDGTPTDCVHLALRGLLDFEPDLVVSGVNAGANLGDDVIYSGTVAAAMEGRFLGLPAIAVSLVGSPAKHFETAAAVATRLVTNLAGHPLPRETVINVNVPDIPESALDGIELARLGQRHKAESVIRSRDPRGAEIYWIGPAGPEADAGDGTDFAVVRANRVAVTPLHTDLTHLAARDATATWLDGLGVR